MTGKYYIGLMSGTSLDGIDAGLYTFSGNQTQSVGFYYQAYNQEIKQKIKHLCTPSHSISLTEYGELDSLLGELYAQSCLQLLQQHSINADEVIAIGSHGQTICHSPNSKPPFTLQIGDPSIISQRTKITTVADFRRKDIAAGGQGAPLVPAFHRAILHSPNENRVIVNIGGIANISILPKDSNKPIIGFDTGPGNTLMDHWISLHRNKNFDEHGQWAAAGKIHTELLKSFKGDIYFSRSAPKSTGPEYFSPTWLNEQLVSIQNCNEADIQRSLCQLTAETISDAIIKLAPDTEKVLVCGGGVHNTTLMQALAQQLKIPVASTNTEGVNPDQVEAMAFAWLAKQTIEGLAGNLPASTGAKEEVILGGIYQA